jgi:hypothetical protein
VTLALAAWLELGHNRTLTGCTSPLIALLAGPMTMGCAAVLRSRVMATGMAALVAAGSLVWVAPNPLWPAEIAPGSGDRRELGVVVGAVQVVSGEGES